jgi:hypothetical protein
VCFRWWVRWHQLRAFPARWILHLWLLCAVRRMVTESQSSPVLEFHRPFMSAILFQGLPLWSSGLSSWLQIQRPGFDSQRYQIFWEVVGLERGLLSLMSTIEELLERKSSGSGLENQEYGRGMSRWLRGSLYPQKLALTSPTSGGRSVGIVHLQTQATEFSLVLFYFKCKWNFMLKIFV